MKIQNNTLIVYRIIFVPYNHDKQKYSLLDFIYVEMWHKSTYCIVQFVTYKGVRV